MKLRQLVFDLGACSSGPLKLYLSTELVGVDCIFTRYSAETQVQNGNQRWNSRIRYDMGEERFIDLPRGMELLPSQIAKEHMDRINKQYFNLLVKGHVTTYER
jgi:hypothetical protein